MDPYSKLTVAFLHIAFWALLCETFGISRERTFPPCAYACQLYIHNCAHDVIESHMTIIRDPRRVLSKLRKLRVHQLTTSVRCVWSYIYRAQNPALLPHLLSGVSEEDGQRKGRSQVRSRALNVVSLTRSQRAV